MKTKKVFARRPSKQEFTEMLVVWEGWQYDPVKQKLNLTPRDFLGPRFPLDEQDFAVIRPP